MNPSLCPFCNAQLPPHAVAPSGDKLPCPRCGEPVPAARWRVDASIAAGKPPLGPLPSPSGGRAGGAGGPPGIRTTALIVLGIMLTMALVSLSYALWTTKLRQARHPWMPKKEEPIVRRRPLELSGLGFLPKGCQFVAGLHVAEMMDDKKVGRKLLDEPQPALVDWILKQVPRATGLTLENLDHVLVAAALDAHFPQLVMVVKTRAPYDLEKLAKSARPAKTPLHQDRPLYEYSLKPLGAAFVWCADERMLIYVLRLDEPKVEHLSGLSAQPRPVEDALPAALRATMQDRLATHHYMWAVGRFDQLGPLKDWLPLAFGARADLAPLKEMTTFALGIEPVEGLTLTGHFQTTDAKSAAKLKTFLENVKIDGAKSQKADVTPADARDQWVTWQVRGDVAVMRALMNQGKEWKK